VPLRKKELKRLKRRRAIIDLLIRRLERATGGEAHHRLFLIKPGNRRVLNN